MSSLLEEAIVDAKALKDAALKNAENAVLEKYSGEVKNAISTLLEQDDLGLTDDDPSPADTSFTEGVPFAFQNEELDAPPGDDLIEIDFDHLKARIAEEEATGEEVLPADLTDTTDLADGIALEEAELGDDEVEEPGAADLTGPDQVDADNKARQDRTAKSRAAPSPMSLEEDEDINLTEEMLSDLIEELVVDMVPRPQGWASMNSADNSIEQANNDAMAAASAAHIDEDEDIEEDVSTASDVVPDVELFETKARVSKLTKSTKELHVLLTESKNQLTKLNLDNAKLVYQNKALNSASLNERQKKQIVEAVQSATSVEEASMIFETIQNAVGSAQDQRTRPQTLREAVQRPTSLLLNSKRNNKATKDPAMGRMLRLAGLNK